jgi:hypothetical protein
MDLHLLPPWCTQAPVLYLSFHCLSFTTLYITYQRDVGEEKTERTVTWYVPWTASSVSEIR